MLSVIRFTQNATSPLATRLDLLLGQMGSHAAMETMIVDGGSLGNLAQSERSNLEVKDIEDNSLIKDFVKVAQIIPAVHRGRAAP